MTLRLPANIFTITTFECFDVTPICMGFSDINTAIRQGVIDGFESNILSYYDNRLYEVCSFVSLTKHLIDVRWLVMPSDVWLSIPEEYRSIIGDCVCEMGITQQNMIIEAEQAALSQLEAYNITINDVNYDKFYSHVSSAFENNDAYKKLSAVIEEYRIKNGSEETLTILSLPKNLRTVETESFANTSVQKIIIPDSVTIIETRAFAMNKNLCILYFEGDPCSIADDIIDGSNNVTVYVLKGGMAEAWALRNSITVRYHQ